MEVRGIRSPAVAQRTLSPGRSAAPPVYRPQPSAGAPRPAWPPVYRPNPPAASSAAVQGKTVATPRQVTPGFPNRAPSLPPPPVYRPNPSPASARQPLQAKPSGLAAPGLHPTAGILPRTPSQSPPPVYRPAAAQTLLPRTVQLSSKRPSGFISNSKKAAVLTHNLSKETDFTFDEKKPKISAANAAMPHRMSWNDINESVEKFADGNETDMDFDRWSNRFLDAGKEKIDAVNDEVDDLEDEIDDLEADIETKKNKKKLDKKDKKELKAMEDELEEKEERKEKLERLHEMQETSQDAFREARDDFEKNPTASNRKEFEKQANSFHANVPDFGPHFGVNNPVSEHAHLHLPKTKSSATKKKNKKRKRSPSPMTRRVLTMSPGRISTIAATQDPNSGDTMILTTTGETVEFSELDPTYQYQIQQHGTHFTKGFDPNFKFG
jgi:hypothetical protein